MYIRAHTCQFMKEAGSMHRLTMDVSCNNCEEQIGSFAVSLYVAAYFMRVLYRSTSRAGCVSGKAYTIQVWEF